MPRAASRSRGTCTLAPGASRWPSWRCAPATRAAASRSREPDMAARITLPGRAEPLEVTPPRWAPGYPPPVSRRVYAAAHVASVDGGDIIDWEATLGFRDHLWAHGFAVAEAMDTAQRGMGLSWWLARELIASSAERAAARRAAGRYAGIACGAGTDHLAPHETPPLPKVIDPSSVQPAFRPSAAAGVIPKA